MYKNSIFSKSTKDNLNFFSSYDNSKCFLSWVKPIIQQCIEYVAV